MLKRPEGGAQSLEIGCLIRNDEPRYILFQVFDHHAVAGRAAGDHQIAPLDFFEELHNFIGHHFTQSGGNLGFWNSLVGGMGAIGFAEYRAAAGNVMG